MKNREVVKKLLELKNSHIEIFGPEQNRNLTCGLASNYSQLIHRIADLLKTSKKALDGLHVSEETYITDPEYNIAEVIGIVIKLLPFAEMNFIDEVLSLLNQNDKNDSSSGMDLNQNKNIYFFYLVHFPLIIRLDL